MKILDYLQINDNFKYSINLDFDMFKKDKIDGFIATRTSVEIINEMLNEIIAINGQPQLFIGPYGKGKSHLLLVLVELLSGTNVGVHNELTKKLIEAKPEIKEQLTKIDKKRYIPVVMTGGYEDFSSNLIRKIKEQLGIYGIENFRIESAYDKAINVLEKYDADKGTSNKTKKMKKGLLNRNEQSYEDFLEFYKKVTFGLDFAPMADTNIMSVIKGVNQYLRKNSEFDGLLIVLDEFSKFLEGRAATESLNDIQDIAEYSASEEGIRLVCVAHKRIAEYISENNDNSNVNEWKKIEARFKHLYFGLFEDEYYYYNLISEVIKKDDRIFSQSEISKQIKSAENNLQSLSFGTQDIQKTKLLSKGVFPLSPYAAYSLVKLSEKIAQNERTLFTFLCGNEVRALKNILKDHPDGLITVDYIYDYFEPIYEDNKTNAIYKIYLKARSVLEKCSDLDEKKVVKVIAVLSFINDTKHLTPTAENIQRSLSNTDISKPIKRLIDDNLILKKSNNNAFTFFSGNGQNINLRINNLANQKYSKIEISKALNEVLDAYYVVPTAYNHTRKITRFFKYVFINDSIFMNEDFILDKFIEGNDADGYVVAVISKNQKESNGVLNHIKDNYNNENVIFIVVCEKRNSSELVRQVYAIDELLNDNKLLKEDTFLKTELIMLKREYLDELKYYWEQVIHENNAKYVYQKNNLQIENYRMLTQKVGIICDKIYSEYPLLNYELLNKHKLSSAIKKARKYVIEKVLNPEYDISTLRDTSSEKTIYRIVVENNQKEFKGDSNLSKVLLKIQELIQSSYMNPITVNTIYDVLIAPPYGIRRGVLPIYLTVVFNLYKHELVISSDGQEVPLSVETIELMADDPSIFQIATTKTTKEITSYIKALGYLFDVDFNSNLFVNDYILVTKGIRLFLNSLPDYSTRFNTTFNGENRIKMNGIHKKIISEFQQYKINPSELLLNKVPKKFYKNSSYDDIIIAFKEMKNLLLNHVKYEKEYLKCFLLERLCDRYSGSLKEGLSYRLSQLTDEEYKIANNKRLNDIKRLSDKFNSHDDIEFVQEISRVMVGLAIEDYGPSMMEKITERIIELNTLIDDLKLKGIDATNRNQISMKLNNKKYDVYVEERPLPVAGTMVINELMEIIDDSFEDNVDKQNVIMNLLKNYV
jgi:hypothetical protein